MKYTCIEDLRVAAKKRVPKMFYDYVDSGSWTEGTYRANTSDFDLIKLRQRVGVDIKERTLKTTMLSQEVAMPLALSPVGMTGMQHADGEILAAKAAKEAGIPFALSTMSICSMEDIAEATNHPFWYQLYVMRDKEFTKNMISRAKKCGVSALILTVDLQVLGQRHKDIKNGLSAPPKPTLANILNLMTKPRWCAGMLGTRRHVFGNIVGHAKGVDGAASMMTWTAQNFDQTLSWNDLEWIKKEWGGPLIIKGILDGEDARTAVDLGVDAIIVSNHGGRQLDGAPSTIEVLPEVVRAVNGKAEVWLDSGIRSGQDVLKAIALGANAAMIGRAYVYGVGADGQEGAARAIEIIRNELDLSMAFGGLTDIKDVNENIIYKRA